MFALTLDDAVNDIINLCNVDITSLSYNDMSIIIREYLSHTINHDAYSDIKNDLFLENDFEIKLIKKLK